MTRQQGNKATGDAKAQLSDQLFGFNSRSFRNTRGDNNMTTESKVYLVTHGYNDREIYAIFKTKEKAEEYCKEKNKIHWSNFSRKRMAIGKSLVTRFNSEPIPSWLIHFEQRASKLL